MYRNRNVIAAATAVGALTVAAPAAAETPVAASIEQLRPLTEAPFEPLAPVSGPAAGRATATRAERRLERDYRALHRRAERRDLEPGRHIAEDGMKTGRRSRPARPRELRTSIGELRQMLREGKASRGGASTGSVGGDSTASPQLEAIAACESGGDPSRIGGGGMYRGKYQFSRETWASVGGSGDPAAASEAEQDRRASALVAQQGTSPWPVCG